jgi:hypothetical protein
LGFPVLQNSAKTFAVERALFPFDYVEEPVRGAVGLAVPESPADVRIAAADGYIYFAHFKTGLLKLGSGRRGTLFLAQVSVLESVPIPASLAVVDGFVVHRATVSSDLVVYSMGNFSESKTVKAPPGFVTGLGSLLFFLNVAELRIFEFGGGELGAEVNRIKLRSIPPGEVDLNARRPWAPGDPSTTIATDGRWLIVQQCTPDVRRVAFSLESGLISPSASKSNVPSRAIAFDASAGHWIDLNDNGALEIRVLHPSYHMHDFWLRKPPSDIVALNAWRAAVSWGIESLVRPSKQQLFWVEPSSVPVFLRFALSIPYSPSLVPFADVCYFSLSLIYRLFSDAPLPSTEEFLGLVFVQAVGAYARTEFCKAVISHPNSPSLFAEFAFCSGCLAALEEDEVITIFSEGFYGLTTFLYAIIYTERGRSILRISADGSPAFLSAVLHGIHSAIAAKKMTQSALLPILELIRPGTFEALFPLCLPHLPALARSPILSRPTLERLEPLLRSPPGDLQEYARQHKEERDHPVQTERVVVAESVHPYPHNADVVKSWDFPGAREIRIEFDPKSATERGCDILEIFTNPRRDAADSLGSFHGRAQGECWRKPISTSAQHITFRFRSDGSVNDWGYKATIRAIFTAKLPFSSPPFSWDVNHELKKLFGKQLPKCPEFKLIADGPGGVKRMINEFLPGIREENQVPETFLHLANLVKGKLTQEQLRDFITAPEGCVPCDEEGRHEQEVRVRPILARLF